MTIGTSVTRESRLTRIMTALATAAPGAGFQVENRISVPAGSQSFNRFGDGVRQKDSRRLEAAQRESEMLSDGD
jgi:hypothetical protein